MDTDDESTDNITDEIIDIEETVDETVDDESTSIAESIDEILVQREIFINLFNELLNESKRTKEKLDMYYVNLHHYYSAVQTSVIIVSTVSTFIQSLLMGEHEDLVPTITLCISTYSSLILSLSKFFKLDEKKEQVHNLRERFAELHNKIRYNIDVLKPWGESEYYDNLTEKKDSWDVLNKQVESEYLNIIEHKKSLFMEFEKIIDSLTVRKYTNKYQKKELKYKNDNLRFI